MGLEEKYSTKIKFWSGKYLEPEAYFLEWTHCIDYKNIIPLGLFYY